MKRTADSPARAPQLAGRRTSAGFGDFARHGRLALHRNPTLSLARDPEIKQTIVSGMGNAQPDVAAHQIQEAIRGRGQYGGCWIRFEPLAGSHGFEFEWASSVEKGLIGAMQHGVLSGVGPSA